MPSSDLYVIEEKNSLMNIGNHVGIFMLIIQYVIRIVWVCVCVCEMGIRKVMNNLYSNKLK